MWAKDSLLNFWECIYCVKRGAFVLRNEDCNIQYLKTIKIKISVIP